MAKLVSYQLKPVLLCIFSSRLSATILAPAVGLDQRKGVILRLNLVMTRVCSILFGLRCIPFHRRFNRTTPSVALPTNLKNLSPLLRVWVCVCVS